MNWNSKDRIRTVRLLALYKLNPKLVQILWTKQVNKFLEMIINGKVKKAIQRAKDSLS